MFFREGQQLLEAGKITDACAKLGTSYELEPALGTLLNLAYCHERMGMFATAWHEYDDASTKAARSGQNERQAFAVQHAKALESKVPRVRLVPPAGWSAGEARVRVDEKPTSLDTDGVFLLDPGTHNVLVSLAGKTSALAKLTARDGSTQDFAPQFEAEASVPPPTPVSASPVTVRDTPVEGPGSTRTIGFIVAGIGAAGIAVGAAFGLMTLSRRNEANCPDKVCASATDRDKIGDAKTFSTVATIGFGVGLVGIATGAYLVITSSSSASGPPAAARARFTPLMGPTGAGIGVDGIF